MPCISLPLSSSRRPSVTVMSIVLGLLVLLGVALLVLGTDEQSDDQDGQNVLHHGNLRGMVAGRSVEPTRPARPCTRKTGPRREGYQVRPGPEEFFVPGHRRGTKWGTRKAGYLLRGMLW